MNSLRVQIIAALLGASAIGFGEVAEFTLSDSLLRQFEFTGSNTDPFYKKGRLIQPNVGIRVSPSLGAASDQGNINLNIQLSGTSRAHSSTPVTRRKSVQAVVDTKVDANFQQEFNLSDGDLHVGKFTGQVNLSPERINVSNNFGLLNGVVNRKALQRAPGQIQAELPAEKQDLSNEVMAGVEKESSASKAFFKDAIDSLGAAFPNPQGLPFEAKISTEGGPDKKLKFNIQDKGQAKERAPKPTFENKDQLLSTGVIHEDLLTQILSQELAGKEMKMSQVRKVLCGPKIQKLINFCKTEPTSGDDNLSLVFDKNEPVKFIFNGGKVNIKMKAAYRTGVPKNEGSSTQLLNSPEETKPEFETQPYLIDIAYKLEDGVAKLQKLSVSETQSAPSIAGALGSFFGGKKDHGGEEAKKGSHPTTEAFLGPLIKVKIHNELNNTLAEEFQFHSVSVPTKVSAKKGANGKEMEVLEAGSLLPVEVKAQDGWLAIGSTFCTESQRALGVNFSDPGVIEAVDSMSPAAMAGFKPGDRIETYSEPSGRSNAFGGTYDPFIQFIKERAANKTASDRKVVISGKDAQGNAFSRTVFLCPSQLNHKEQMLKGFAQFKGAK